MANKVLSIQPAGLDIKVRHGATFNPVITWRTVDEDGAAADPIDLTGYTARMQIRETVNAATILHTLTTENGGIFLGGVLGTITLFISDADTTGITPDACVYDLEIVSPAAQVTSLLAGKFTFTDEVTR